MRYALRKKEKISEVFSEEYLKEHIIASLDNVFKNTPTEIIEEALSVEYQTINGKNYQVIRINDVADKDCMLEFAVIEKRYDVLKLSFLGRMKG